MKTVITFIPQILCNLLHNYEIIYIGGHEKESQVSVKQQQKRIDNVVIGSCEKGAGFILCQTSGNKKGNLKVGSS